MFNKIVPPIGAGVVGLPDTPELSALDMQKKFDELSTDYIIPAFNETVDGLNALETTVSEIDQSMIDHEERTDNPHEVTKAQVGLGSVDNTSDMDKPVSTAQQAALNQSVANVLTKDNTTPFTPTQDYQPATKKYADDLAFAAGSVSSVFGRAGAVTAQTGDYTPEQVGATPAAHALDTTIHVTSDDKTLWNGAMPTAGGTFTGQVTAGGEQNIEIGQVRNITISTGEPLKITLTPPPPLPPTFTQPLSTGTLWLVYEEEE